MDELANDLSEDAALPIFEIQQVQLNVDTSADFVAAQVANNILILAFSTGRILRFDLDNDGVIDDIDIPQRASEVGVIRKLFLDPSASHLLISTTLGENYYLHTQGRQPKPVPRLRGIQIDSVAWNPLQPTASTREILIGSGDGNIYEITIDPSLRHLDKNFHTVYNVRDGAVLGMFAEILGVQPDTRRLLLASQTHFFDTTGPVSARGQEGGRPLYARLFENETSIVQEAEAPIAGISSSFAVSPNSYATEEHLRAETDLTRAYAWLSARGITHGYLNTSRTGRDATTQDHTTATGIIPLSKLRTSQPLGARTQESENPSALLLTDFHVLVWQDGWIIALNRLDESVVFRQQILGNNQTFVGLYTDHQKHTYWLLTSHEIHEIAVSNEDRNVWRILLQRGSHEAAQQYARTEKQLDVVAGETGDHLMSLRKFTEAAKMFGESSRPFEDVALAFIDHGERNALRQYLLTRLSRLKKVRSMQRTMFASWIIELFMAELNELDDAISMTADGLADQMQTTVGRTQERLPIERKAFQRFATEFKADLDRKTTYEVISAHGREQELLFFANIIEDYEYVLTYWVNRERWEEAMDVLKKQSDPAIFHKFSAVLMCHSAVELIELLMRQQDVDPKLIIPALLNYNKTLGESALLNGNQAIRYLQFCVNTLKSTEPAVHNTLISMYASHAETNEDALLQYLRSQSAANKQFYDADFALRLCIANDRVRSAVHVYTSMRQYASAVELALKYGEVELAADVADKQMDEALRKKLWLKIAKKVIGRSSGIKAAIDFLKRCKQLKIEDLIPFFPDFVVIDAFKEEICTALEAYSRQIDDLKHEMDESAKSAQHIKDDIRNLDHRYAIVEPGERCWKCRLPLLMRQFFVFPCQHAFHADCLGEMVIRLGSLMKDKRIRELQREIGRGVALSEQREAMVKELDSLVAESCVLCNDVAVKQIEAPFVMGTDELNEWTL